MKISTDLIKDDSPSMLPIAFFVAIILSAIILGINGDWPWILKAISGGLQ